MLNIQKFLRSNPIESLEGAPYFITAKPHPKYPNLLQFKYDQLSSDFANPMVRECRGIILDSANDWKVVCYSFSKFFNAEESLADPIDWPSAKVQLKADGSLMQLFYYDNQWHVASSGTPDASGQVNGHNITFAELFWETFFSNGLKLELLGLNNTFSFELTTPLNMVVVRNKENKVTLIGVRDNHTLSEYPLHYWEDIFPVIKEFPLDSIESVNGALKGMNGLEQEGFVVVDKHFNRIKCKSANYVSLHHLKDSLSASPKSLVDIIRKGESTEFLGHFEEFRGLHDKLKAKYDRLTEWHDEFFVTYLNNCNGDRKAFAQLAAKTLIPGYYFARLDGKTRDIKHYISEMNIDHLMSLLYKV